MEDSNFSRVTKLATPIEDLPSSLATDMEAVLENLGDVVASTEVNQPLDKEIHPMDAIDRGIFEVFGPTLIGPRTRSVEPLDVTTLKDVGRSKQNPDKDSEELCLLPSATNFGTMSLSSGTTVSASRESIKALTVPVACNTKCASLILDTLELPTGPTQRDDKAMFKQYRWGSSTTMT